MNSQTSHPDRVISFSDGVFAIIITLLVLELRAPQEATVVGLLALWPSAVAYGVSYLFLAIVWVNHHHLMRHAAAATPRLMWANFAHLFTVSLMPFTTAWIAQTHLAALPVAVYAVVFVLINVTYLFLCMEAMDKQRAPDLTPATRRMMRMRSIVTLGVFALAAGLALISPVAALGLISACLLVYVRPDAPTASDGVAASAPRKRRLFTRLSHAH